MIGGASLRGGLRAPYCAGAGASRREDRRRVETLSAKAFRDAVRACKAESLDHRQASKREAQLERERQVQELLDQHVTDAKWSEMLEKAKLAALNGEQEFMMLRFPFGPLQRRRPKDRRRRGGLGRDPARRRRRALRPVANRAQAAGVSA